MKCDTIKLNYFDDIELISFGCKLYVSYTDSIIAVSGNALVSDIHKFKGVGGTAFMTKPFNKNDILNIIQQNVKHTQSA